MIQPEASKGTSDSARAPTLVDSRPEEPSLRGPSGVNGMSQEGIARLEEIVRAVVTGSEGAPEATIRGLAAELRTHPKLLLDALKELSDLGSESRDRAPATVESMRGLVHEVLRVLGFRDQWPGHVPVAHGIVDLIAREAQTYHQQREGGARS